MCEFFKRYFEDVGCGGWVLQGWQGFNSFPSYQWFCYLQSNLVRKSAKRCIKMKPKHTWGYNTCTVAACVALWIKFVVKRCLQSCDLPLLLNDVPFDFWILFEVEAIGVFCRSLKGDLLDVRNLIDSLVTWAFHILYKDFLSNRPRIFVCSKATWCENSGTDVFFIT